MSKINPTRSTLLVGLLLFGLLASALPYSSAVRGQGNATPAATVSAAATGAATVSAPVAAYTGTFDGTILFGTPLSLTGSLSKEGNLSKEGYEIWKDVYNTAGGIKIGDKHYKIEIKYYDDTSNAQTSASLADKLIKEDKIQFLLGPYGTSAVLQVSTVAEKNKIPMVEGNGVAESIFSQGYQYTFLVSSPAKNYLQGAVDMALAQDPKPATLALLSADDPFSVEVAEATRKYAESKGLQVVYYQKYPNNSTDLRAPLTEAKGKNPDLFLNSGHFAESVAIIQQAKELGFNAHGYGFSVGPSLPDFYSTLKDDAHYVFGGAQWKAAGTLDPQAVRDSIAKLDFVAFFGHIKFDERGVNIFKPMVVEQWQNGKKQTIWPADVASGKPLWPAPEWGKR